MSRTRKDDLEIVREQLEAKLSDHDLDDDVDMGVAVGLQVALDLINTRLGDD